MTNEDEKKESEGELSYNSRKVKALEKLLNRKPTWQEMLAMMDDEEKIENPESQGH